MLRARSQPTCRLTSSHVPGWCPCSCPARPGPRPLFPGLCNGPRSEAWNHRQGSPDQVEEDITLWIAATQYYFEQMAKDIEFPGGTGGGGGRGQAS